MNGSMRKHAKTEGYIVDCDQFIGLACYGLADVNHTLLLNGSWVATLFPTRRAAQQAIKQSQQERPEDKYRIIRVARLAK